MSFFVAAKEHPFVIRVAQNRRIEDTHGNLRTLMNTSPVAGEFTLEVPARPQQPAREAHLQVHFARTTLRPPYRCQLPETEKLAPCRGLSRVGRRTASPRWHSPSRLATADECRSFPTSLRHCNASIGIPNAGTSRSISKSLNPAPRLSKPDYKPKIVSCVISLLLSVIAWRLYSMTLFNRHVPEADCTQVVTENEWRALYALTHKTRTFPEKTPTVAQVVLWIAKLGGFLGRKSDSTPGVTALWRGLATLDGYFQHLCAF